MTTTPNNSVLQPSVVPTQEVRFAIVMYGGVSLAIYMNGITQELLELVRSTTPSKLDNTDSPVRFSDLTGSGRVYRKLGQLLGSEFTEQGRQTLANINANPQTPISTRFVIDLLSGTSAGGINAVFLAKALANGKSVEGLKKLWIEEGDIGKLINDSQSLQGLRGMRLKQQPESLFNSERMYIKLLEGLDDVENSTNTVNSLVTDLDLYITATDLYGQTVPIQLADKTVYENRYRQVFHFILASDGDEDNDNTNDFHYRNDPFLAFAARCSSSFPVAFEPMTLHDAEKTLRQMNRYNETDFARWRQQLFNFSQVQDFNTDSQDNQEDFKPFADGGYLNNKPFTYVVDRLLRHRSDVPVASRKLIYIDPSPEHPEDENPEYRTKYIKPNILENVEKAVLTLPRYETIRENIERVLEQNRLIERVFRITNDSTLEKDIESLYKNDQSEDPKTLKDLIRSKGVTYGSYHRLRISTVTDDLAKLLTRAAGFDPESAWMLAIRRLLREWRENNYTDFPTDNSTQKPDIEFLEKFDFEYHLRQLYYLRRKVYDLYPLSDTAKETIQHITNRTLNPKEEAYFRAELKRIKYNLSKLIKGLLYVKHKLRKLYVNDKLSQKNNLYAAYKQIKNFKQDIIDIGIKQQDLQKILNQLIENEQKPLTESRNNQAAIELFNDKHQQLEQLANKLASIFEMCFESERKWRQELEKDNTSVAKTCIKHYYDFFSNYDIVTFPIFYGTNVNEAIKTEIIRISPEDATTLINERFGNEQRRKLAGNQYSGFGGFLKREWRQNDILWGRLDGAERIITTLLPEKKDELIRNELIKETQQAIIAEELKPEERQYLLKLLCQALANIQPSDKNEQKIREFIQKELQSPLETKFKIVLESCLDDRELWNYFQKNYEVDRRLASDSILRYIARSTQVIGKIIDGLSHQESINTKAIGFWLTRLGQILWGLVEIAVPKSLGSILFRYWLQLLYLTEIILIISGFLLSLEDIQNFGWQALGITLVVNLATFIFSDLIRRPNLGSRGFMYVGVAVWSALGVIGLYYLWQQLPDISHHILSRFR